MYYVDIYSLKLPSNWAFSIESALKIQKTSKIYSHTFLATNNYLNIFTATPIFF
jgi:hypothetical protein